jgi:predicted RNA-binding Zn ribbon-like protein
MREPLEPGLKDLLAFVNTIDIEGGSDELGDATAAGEWLGERGYGPRAGRLGAADAERLRGFREALRSVLRANHDGIEAPPFLVLAPFTEAATLQVCFDADGPRLEAQGDGPGRFVGSILAAVYDAVRDATWTRLKICSSPTCQWGFFDRSRNRSGNWCSMAGCGNRAKVRAYRARKAAEGEA